jgi:two-component system phosphate regulon sensor histidine kinase PhoR
VLELLTERLAARDITAGMEIEPGLPPVLAPAGDLDMILANLVDNAVKYNCDGGSITVRAQHDREWVRIDVEDTGIGIAAEHVDDVLTEFFREKRPETRNLEGSGLGLAIVRRLAERAGGRLELTSEEGRGSTFSILLPA